MQSLMPTIRHQAAGIMHNITCYMLKRRQLGEGLICSNAVV